MSKHVQLASREFKNKKLTHVVISSGFHSFVRYEKKKDKGTKVPLYSLNAIK